ncbi:MAG: hypothetical protein K2M27_06535 [Muribaculaceae bacterium]|nr:hypothetical protein [Muribaculaceae bacterium]
MKKIYILPILLSPLIMSCGDSPKVENSRPGPDPSPKPVVTDFYISPASSGCLMEVSRRDFEGIRAIVGHGYDVTGDYLDPSSLRASVVDTERMPDDAFSVFSAPAYNSGETYLGEDARSLLSDLMANLGESSDGANRDYYFTGTIGQASSNSSYVMQTTWQRYVIAGFPGTDVTVRRYLSDEFTADLALLSADGLVRKYGTHFISRASAGLAMREIYSAYLPSAGTDLTPLLDGFRAASASIEGAFNGVLADKLSSLYNYGARLNVTFIGGKTDVVEYDEEKAILASIDEWWKTGESGNYGLIDISGLHPLSVAIADRELAAQVDTSIRKYISEAQTKLERNIPLFQNSDGLVYRYVASAEASAALDKSGIKSYGVLGALSSEPTETTPLPLYSNLDTDGNQILSLIQPTVEWKRLGYVLKERTETCVPLYEISDGNRYAYTIEAANSYGKKNEWHPTGAVFYLLRP